ncbi:hypothetical protein [Sphingomonas profundi]|uniref:hypothetical protein n=1 Tax=Alterirhizorhabdus profundi TaxID=2681549 RepID=UPI001E4F0B0C|nr:hypothetical protein [Sphingomonas profundi]
MALDKALRGLAERNGMSVYAMLQRSVATGVTALANPATPDTTPQEIIAELASLSVAVVDLDRTLDRALFTACAAYCYARSAAMNAHKTDEAITVEINAAYDRQRRLSREARP